MAADAAGSEEENVILIVDENVQIFYIGKDNVVTAPTDPSFLRAVVNEMSDDDDVPLGFLQVGDWKHPLNMNRKPVYKLNSGTYVFPDLSLEENAAYVGISLPAIVSKKIRTGLEKFLHEFSGLQEFPVIPSAIAEALSAAETVPAEVLTEVISASGSTRAVSTKPEAVSDTTAQVTGGEDALEAPAEAKADTDSTITAEVVPNAEAALEAPAEDQAATDNKAEEVMPDAEAETVAPTENDNISSSVMNPGPDTVANEPQSGWAPYFQIGIPTMPELPGGIPVSTMVAASFMAGAEKIGHSLVYSAEQANQLILQGTRLIMKNISPAEEELLIPVEVLLAFDAVQEATGRAVEFSDFLVTNLKNGTVKLGKWAMPYLRTASHKMYATVTSSSDDEAGQSMDQLLQVAGGCAVGVGTVYAGLDHAARVIGNSIADSTAQIVKKKYGRQAGSVVGCTAQSIGNAVTAKNTMKSFIPNIAVKAVAQSSAESFMHEVPPQKGTSKEPAATTPT